MRICIDLDGTICEIKKDGESYSDVKMKPGADVMIKKLHDAGHEIIIYTARNMASTGHNVGKAIKNIGNITLEWLEANNIIYDEIFFGKPNSDVVIDDRCVRFDDNWYELNESFLTSKAKKR